MSNMLSLQEIDTIDAYWRAANYLSVGQIYLLENPLLWEPLQLAHIKPRLLGYWGTTPGLNFLYVHVNRVIKKFNANVIYITDPGHGGPRIVASVYLEGTVFPGGIGEHAAPVRWEGCAGLRYVGVQLDPQRNAAHADPVSMPQRSCAVHVIPTNEDLMTARHTRAVLFPRDAKSIQE